MRVGSSVELWWERPINRYLLCSVLAKHTRHLAPLFPEKRVAELIGIARQNCAECAVGIQFDGNTPKVIREQAAVMFSLAEISASPSATRGVTLPGSQTANGFSVDEQQREKDGSSPSRPRTDFHMFKGRGVDSADSCCSLPGRDSMSRSDWTDWMMRQLRLQALAENLYRVANRHRENRNYIVAYVLYGRALETAREVDISQDAENWSAFVDSIQKDQQAAFGILYSGQTGSPGAPKSGRE